MQAAVSTVLAECPSQVTAWDAFEDCRFWTGFKPSRRTASQAAGGPHSSRNLWQPQVAFSPNFVSMSLQFFDTLSYLSEIIFSVACTFILSKLLSAVTREGYTRS